MNKKIISALAVIAVMTWTTAIASAAQVEVVRGNTLWGITTALGQPGENWTQLYRENPDLPPISIDGQGRNIAWISAGDYLQVPDNWNLGSADLGYVSVVRSPEGYPGYVPPAGNESPLAWMNSEWFKTLVVGLLLLLAFVLGTVLVRRFGQPMYGGFPGMPMFIPPMRNELNITYTGVPPAAPVVVSEAPASAAPVVVDEPTTPVVPADATPADPAEAESSVKTEAPAAGQ